MQAQAKACGYSKISHSVVDAIFLRNPELIGQLSPLDGII